MTVQPHDLLARAEDVLRDLDDRLERAENEHRARAFLEQLHSRRERALALGASEIVAEIDRLVTDVEAFLGTYVPAPSTEPEAPSVTEQPTAVVHMIPEAQPEALPEPVEAVVAPDAEALKEFHSRASRVLSETEQLAKQKTWDGKAMARLKALAARLRALEVWAGDLSEDPQELEKAHRRLRDVFNRHYRGQYHTHGFPLHDSRSASRALWEELAHAYDLLAEAEEAFERGIHDDPVLSVAERTEFMATIAAPEAHLFRLLKDEFDGASDQQQHDFHAELEALAQEREWYIPTWHPTLSNSDVARLAAKLPDQIESRTKLIETRRTRKAALGRLAELLDTSPVPEDFEERLCDLVADCLKAGVPESDKELRALVLPYQMVLEEADDEGVRRVAKEVAKELSRQRRKSEPEPVEPEPRDAEHDGRLAKVVEFTRGKKMLFMGGKPQEERRRQLETMLDLTELVWPDCEHDSKPSEFMDLARKVDIMCYLVRWSRKSVREVAKECKDSGGEVVRLPAGVGTRRVVQELYEQLVANRHDA